MITSKEQVSQIELQKASRKRRIVAFIIDHFVMTFLIVCLVFLISGPNMMNESNPFKMTKIMLTIMIPGFLIYFAKDCIKGISVGKWIMGIMVRDAQNPNEVPSIGRLFLRNLFVIIWPIEFIVLATSQEKKRLGDNVAQTIVVKNPNKPSKAPRILALIAVGFIAIMFLVFVIGNTMKNSEAYKVSVQAIEQNNEILNKTGGIVGYGMFPAGSISIQNGYGQANLSITVLGKNEDVDVMVYLEKEPGGEWKIIEISQ